MNKINEYQQLGVVVLIVAIFAGFITYSLSEGMKKSILNKENKELKEENIRLVNERKNLKNWFVEYEYEVTVTGYHPVEEQCDDTPDITADGTRFEINYAGEMKWVALSRDLLVRWNGKIHYGNYIYLSGTKGQDGIYQVRDTMNSRHTNWVDILLTPGQDSFYYKDITMYKIISKPIEDPVLFALSDKIN